MQHLHTPYQMGNINLPNRIVMAPLTRRRAENPELAPNALMAEYYRQRASAGLIISEGSQVSAMGYGYTHTPGIYTEQQVEGWKKVTAAVHAAGGRIFIQLWHVGALSHPHLLPQGVAPLSASAIKPHGEVLTPLGHQAYEKSVPMTIEQIRQTINDFGQAAHNAMKAGFDGVEIHGAHGYLIDQFIMDGTNERTDDYGGSISNRARLLFEILEAVLREVPEGKTGIRLSPKRVRPGMSDSQPLKTYGYIIDKLNDYPLAFLHLSEMLSPEERLADQGKSFMPQYRGIYQGTLISCGGHSQESAEQMLQEGLADLIAFGKPFISNPDLAERLQNRYPLQDWDKDTFYHGAEKGYTDYPQMGEGL